MGGSIIELILIVIVFISSMLIPVTGTCLSSIIDNAAKTSGEIKKTVSNPYASIIASPKNISNSAKDFKNVSKNLFSKVSQKVLKQRK
jgi:predicted PurR-regulated permease PerM